ncbi:ARM repeat-containing protein [Sistotremastrum suecicum HHB10207 ss-3]|uniref:ARM repeat-containing protein n=1 Tax=Sistotremastrum suecicum HHB10207 ss-3 TaxID=1314776 RepID=A0A166J1Q1_9AGAM|nr:ARM repeat-containing protein [Sistotremastrum suecicum HHB10207 ss-3]
MSLDLLTPLVGTLSPDANTRMSSELALAELSKNPESSIALARVLLSQEADISVRQMKFVAYLSCVMHSAGTVLRKYINEHWSPYFPSFKGNAPSIEIKSVVREAILQGLSDPNRKIRSLCAYILSTIAHSDWPDDYPALLDQLVTLISSNHSDSIHGAMQVFADFIKADLTEDQVLPLLRQLLPVMITIIMSPQSHSPLTRARTVKVFRQCVESLYMVQEQHPQAVKEAVANVLPSWIDAFQKLLEVDVLPEVQNTADWDALVLRVQLYKTLETLHTTFPKALASSLADLLQLSVLHLVTLLPAFTTFHLPPTESAPGCSEPDESVSLPQLSTTILDFIAAIARGGKSKAWFANTSNLETLIQAIFGWSQMSEDDEEEWAENANAFVAQEKDENLEKYGPRSAGFDLIGSLIERWPSVTVKCLQAATQQALQISQNARQSGQDDWWRPLEASLACSAANSESITEYLEEEDGAQSFDVKNLSSEILPSLHQLSATPFLQGRSFVFASKFASLLSSDVAQQYFSAAIEVVESNNVGVPVKLSAVLAIKDFCRYVDGSRMSQVAPRLANDLGPLLLVATEDTLSLTLETIGVLLEVDKGAWLDSTLAVSLATAFLDVWRKNLKDHIMMSILESNFLTLVSVSADGVYEAVLNATLPPLCQALLATTADESWVAGSALDLLASLMSSTSRPGLLPGLFEVIATPLFHALDNTEDRDVIQRDFAQVLAWHQADGRTGLQRILGVIARLLEPSKDESGGLVVGDLIVQLIRQGGGSIKPLLPELIQAMVLRMPTAKTATFSQSLIVPIALLIYLDSTAVIQLLEETSIPSPDQGTRSALDVFLNTWCENAVTIQGLWASRISVLALCQLFASDRSSLKQVHVQGDMLIMPETKDVIVTRARAKKTPHKFASIPFPLKALKLILSELRSEGDGERVDGQGNPAVDLDSDDGDEDWADEETQYQGFKKDEFEFLSEMLGPGGANFDNDEDVDEDEDLLNDPVSQMDIKGHLVSFLRECGARNVNDISQLTNELNAEEILILQRAVHQ